LGSGTFKVGQSATANKQYFILGPIMIFFWFPKFHFEMCNRKDNDIQSVVIFVWFLRVSLNILDKGFSLL
jgi:hypothetical protein